MKNLNENISRVKSIMGLITESDSIFPDAKDSDTYEYKKEDGTVVECKKVYRLNIKMPKQFNPFRLKRKADLYNTPKKYKIGRYIKDIKLEGGKFQLKGKR